jgi:signal transduction histidine kinase/ligand-binding sensor domain-containing protein
LSHWSDGRLVSYLKEPGLISAILEDQRGKVWITRSRVPNAKGLCQVFGSKAECYPLPDETLIGNCCHGLLEDGQGNLWIGTSTGLVRWRDGLRSIHPNRNMEPNTGTDGVVALAPALDGSLWVGIAAAGPGMGLEQFEQDRWKPFLEHGLDGSKLEITALLRDRDGALWLGTIDQGIYRVHGNKVDHFDTADGLSGKTIWSFYQDREGNIWVVTTEGIDYFRDLPVVSFSTEEGLKADDVVSVLAARDGTIWVGNDGSLDSIRDGTVSSLPTGKGLPGRQVTSLLEDNAGRLWVGVDDKLWIYQNGHFAEIKRADGGHIGTVAGITEDAEDNIWATTIAPSRKLVRIRNFIVTEEAQVQHPFARELAADRHGGIWLGLMNGDLARYRHGNFETFSFHHVPNQRVRQVVVNPDDSVLGVTAVGLIGWKDGKLQTMTVRNGLPCDDIFSVVSDQNNYWLYAQCGLVKISEAQMQQWWDQPSRVLQVKTIDQSDGVRPHSAVFSPAAARSPDGKLWFANNLVLQTFDPAHRRVNSVVPPVNVEQITADRRSYPPTAGVALPALVRNLEIDYTALSFVAPEKVRFRYKLEGHDTTWQEAGTRRQAFYNDLRPGQYRFRVIACNNDGVWNETGALLSFSIRPAYYQTTWFRVLCVATFLSLLWVAYKFRVRQLERRLKLSEENSRLYGELRQRDAESERLRQELADLARLNRVSTMGELTASLAHEIKQPIGAAVTNAEACARLLDRDQPDMPEAREAALEMAKDARRAAHIIDRVRSLYRKTSLEFEAVDVNEIIEEMALMLQNEANRHSVTIRTELAENLPSTMADRVQLQQVLMNLMLNGIEAMRDTSGELSIQSQLAGDGQLLVSVTDTGVGLPTDNVERIFNAFFTTKSEGTGLGLAITRSIVESHSGRIWATPNPRRGTSFHFTLPSRATVPAPTSSNPYCVH